MGVKTFLIDRLPDWMVQDPLQAGGDIPKTYQKTLHDQELADRRILTTKEPRAMYLGHLAAGDIDNPEN